MVVHCVSRRRRTTSHSSPRPPVTASRPAIVLVDDEQPLLDFLTFMLRENLRCPVHAFTRPRVALASLPRLAPAVVVTDYCMPELDGFALIREASLAYPDLPFIMMTGHVIDPAAERVRQSAALRVILSKPFGWRVLAEEILRHAPKLEAAAPPSGGWPADPGRADRQDDPGESPRTPRDSHPCST